MRLADLDPGWFSTESGRRGQGIHFLCPHCKNTHIIVLFSNPIDGGPASIGEDLCKPRWLRTGDTFDTLTISPSINSPGHWHGWVKNGEVT